MRRNHLVTWALCMGVVVCAGRAHGEAFTYQGRLQQDGAPADGSFNISFRLWDAPAGGTQVGGPLNIANVPVSDGFFTVQLDFGVEVFENTDRWLQIVVAGTPLAPRQPITRAPYAIQTRGIFVDDDENVGIGTTAPVFPLHVETDVAAAAKASPAIYARNLLTDGFTYGLWAQSDSVSGRGLFGYASANSGTTYGVRGEVDSPDGYAAYFTGPLGSANYFQRYVGIGTTNPQYPLDVDAIAPIGIRVIQNNAAFASAVGIRSETNSTDGAAIVGEATDINGSAAGVEGESAGSEGVGVMGIATSLTGANRGVIGDTLSTTGIGVYASASNGSGINYALVASAVSADGYAGYFVGARNYMNGFLGLNKLEPEVRLDVVGSIQYTGSLTDVSDMRLKENIEPILRALDSIMQIDGVSFNMIDAPDERELGLIAQDVQQVLPDAVRVVDSKTGHLGVSYPSLVPVLVEAIKQLRAEKDAELGALRAEKEMEIASLQAQIDDLRRALLALTEAR